MAYPSPANGREADKTKGSEMKLCGLCGDKEVTDWSKSGLCGECSRYEYDKKRNATKHPCLICGTPCSRRSIRGLCRMCGNRSRGNPKLIAKRVEVSPSKPSGVCVERGCDAPSEIDGRCRLCHSILHARRQCVQAVAFTWQPTSHK